MHDKLEAIKDAWDKNTGDGRVQWARTLADQFVAENPELFTQVSEMSLADCVKAVEVFRAAGMTEDQWRVEAWLLHRYAPQRIGGVAEIEVRLREDG